MRLDEFNPLRSMLRISAGRRPVEASFTHGSSAQRMEWLRKGLESGNDATCDALMR